MLEGKEIDIQDLYYHFASKSVKAFKDAIKEYNIAVLDLTENQVPVSSRRELSFVGLSKESLDKAFDSCQT